LKHSPLAHCYITFYDCNLQIFVIRHSTCPRKAFTAKSNVCEHVWSLPECSSFQSLHSRVGSLPYPQILDYARKAWTFVNYGIKCFVTFWPRSETFDSGATTISIATLSLMTHTPQPCKMGHLAPMQSAFMLTVVFLMLCWMFAECRHA